MKIKKKVIMSDLLSIDALYNNKNDMWNVWKKKIFKFYLWLVQDIAKKYYLHNFCWNSYSMLGKKLYLHHVERILASFRLFYLSKKFTVVQQQKTILSVGWKSPKCRIYTSLISKLENILSSRSICSKVVFCFTF